MSEEYNEDIASQNDDNGGDYYGDNDESNGDNNNQGTNALQERLNKLEETNRQLYARAKKAEGFVKKDGKWIKKETQQQTQNTESTQEPENKPKGLDYGQKAYLIANGIKGKDEMDFVQKHLQESGKSLEELLENSYFQQSLQEFREGKKADNAIPKKGKRSSSPSQDEIDYWLAKGELPPAENIELRRKVVNAKLKQQKAQSQFSDNPVIGG